MKREEDGWPDPGRRLLSVNALETFENSIEQNGATFHEWNAPITRETVRSFLGEIGVAEAVFANVPELELNRSAESRETISPILRSLSCPSPEQRAERLHSAEAGVFRAEWGLAPQGVLAVELPSDAMGTVSLVPETSVIVLSADSVVDDGKILFEKLADAFEEGRTNWVIVSGPSATADMGALVQGVHGPERVHVIIIQDDE